MQKKKGINFQEANRIASESIRDWLPGYDDGKRQGDWVNGIPNPTRPDRNTDSFGVNPVEGRYKDFASGEVHDLLHLYAVANGLTDKDAALSLLPASPEPYETDISTLLASLDKQRIPTIPGEWDHIHQYSDGVCSFFVCRRDARDDKPKEIRPATLSGGQVIFKKPPKPAQGYPLLNLDKILMANPEQEIVLVEGEVKSEAIPEPYIATSIAGGANAWKDTDLSPLQGRRVILWPDNDEPGKKCMEEIRSILPEARIITPSTDWPKGADAANFSYKERLSIIQSAKKVEKQEPFPLIPFDEMEVKAPQWIIKNILEMDCSSVFFGGPGAGKSFLVLSLAAHILTKTEFYGNEVKKSGPVIYIAGEGFSGLSRRLRAWEIYHKQKIPPKSLFISRAPAALGDPEFMVDVENSVRSVAEKYGNPVLIIIDTWARSLVGDENSSADVGAAVRALNDLRREYKSSCLVVHHSGLGDATRARGSSALKGSLDAEYRVENNDGIMTLSNSKMKDGETPEPMTFSFETVKLGIEDEDGDPVCSSVVIPMEAVDDIKNQGRLVEAIDILKSAGGNMREREFNEKMIQKGVVQRTVGRIKKKLIEQKKIVKVGNCIEIVKIKEELRDDIF